MQKGFFILLFVLSQALMGQAIHNYGNLQLHNKGLLGFHTDFVNDSGFDKNLGLIGFYQQDRKLSISGAFSPSFYDFEVAVENDLYLDVSINIDNSLSFIYGNVKSPRNNKNIYTKLAEKAIYDGAMDLSKVDGHVAVEGQKKFSFPVGYDDIIRPLQIEFADDIFYAKCEYFHENPDYPESSAISFDTKSRDPSLGGINMEEFWNLTTSGRVQITLNWNSGSNLQSSVGDIKYITVVGWSKINEQWDNLGNTLYEGNIDSGWATSNVFNANDYEIFTLGFLFDLNANEPGNYPLTPNGDGVNDFFSLKILEQSSDNILKIFDRAGLLVFEKSNYRDEFSGIANKNIARKYQQLPEGVYFYLLELKDLNLKYQGYIYLVAK